MSANRRAVYLALLTIETLVGVPMVALLELYTITYQPRSPFEWALTAAWHALLIATLLLTVVAWRKVLR